MQECVFGTYIGDSDWIADLRSLIEVFDVCLCNYHWTVDTVELSAYNISPDVYIHVYAPPKTLFHIVQVRLSWSNTINYFGIFCLFLSFVVIYNQLQLVFKHS